MDDSKNKKNNEDEIDAEPVDNGELKFEADADAENLSKFKNKDVVADLRAKLKQSEEKKHEYLTGWQRAKADFVNSRRLDDEANRSMVKFAEMGLISEIIPILDSFDIAFVNAEKAFEMPEEWKKGMAQIHKQILSLLTDHDVKVIDPLGKPFDPKYAEAVGIIETKNSDEDHIVLSVFQKGYTLHDRVIRPAKVQVGSYSESEKA